MNLSDPKSVKQVNAELATLNADLVAYANTHGVKLTTKTYTHPVGTSAQMQACEQKNGCELVSAYVDKGVLRCVYNCVASGIPQKKQ